MNNFFRNFLRKRNSLGYKIFMTVGTNQDGKFTYVTQLSEYLGKHNNTVTYWITKFKEEGLIDYGLELSENGKSLFKFLWENLEISNLRAHNIQIVFFLSKCPDDYIERYSSEIFSFITNGRYRGLIGKIFGITCMFYSPKKIVCVLRNIYGDTDEDISSGLQIIASDLKARLEKHFDGITIGGNKFAKIQTSHIAVLDSLIAKSFDLRGFTYEGKYLAIDKSHGRHEIELTDPRVNLKDIMKLLDVDKKEDGRRL